MKRHGFTIGLLLMILVFTNPMASFAWDSEQVVDNGDPNNRVNIVIVGDGFTASELGKFGDAVDDFVNYFFNTAPFDAYRDYYNVYKVNVISNQSGSDHPTKGIYKDTALNSSFSWGGNVERCVYADASKVYAAAADAPVSATPGMILVLVNDPQYGGCGGSFGVFSIHPYFTDVAVHELGHSFGKLADEYFYTEDTYIWSDPSQANVTTVTNRNNIKWKHWIAPQTAVPTTTTSNGVPGLYQGGSYYKYGIYRPTHNSKMRALFKPFEQINSEALILKTYNRINPIDGYSPSASTVDVPSGGAKVFSVTPMKPTTHNLTVKWYLNNTLIGTGNAITVNNEDMSSTSDTLRVDVVDEGDVVRSDPAGLLNDTHSWTLTRVDEPVMNSVADATFYTGIAHSINVSASYSGAVTLSAELSNGDALSTIGATFTDHGNKTGTLNWTPGDSHKDKNYAITFKASNGTVTDSETATINVLDASAGFWRDVSGSSISGSSLTKTAASAWGNAGGSSIRTFTGDGNVTFKVNGYSQLLAGVSSAPSNGDYAAIEFSMFFNSAKKLIYVYENGKSKGNYGSYTPSDTFSVERDGTTIEYKRNGETIYTSTASSSAALMLDVVLADQGSGIVDASVSGAQTDDSQSDDTQSDDTQTDDTQTDDTQSDDTQSDDTNSDNSGTFWKDVNGSSVNGTAITKTAASAWDNAGAASATSFTGDGKTEFTVNGYLQLLAGLSSSNPNDKYTSLEYGMYFRPAKKDVLVYESGKLKGVVTTYTTSDTFSVERVGTTILYKKNGSTIYTSENETSAALMLDVVLADQGSGLASASITGGTTQQDDTQSDDAQSDDTQSDDTQTDDTQSDDTQSDDTQTDDTQSDDSNSDNSSTFWKDVNGSSVNGSSITKTADSAWDNAGAASATSFSGDGKTEFKVNGYLQLLAGLSSSNPNDKYTSLEYGMYFRPAKKDVLVYESGKLKGVVTTYTTSDTFSVERVGSTILYKKNGSTIYTSEKQTSAALMLDVVLADKGSGLVSASVTGGTTQQDDTQSDDTQSDDTQTDDTQSDDTQSDDTQTDDTQNNDSNDNSSGGVSWRDVNGASVNGASITKTAASAWGNAGAASTQTMSGDGNFEFGVNAYLDLLVGVSSSNPDDNYATIQYAMYFSSAKKAIYIYENGKSKGVVGSFSTNDRFSIERVGTTIHYKKNGVMLYTSTASTSAALMMDVVLAHQGAGVVDAQLN